MHQNNLNNLMIDEVKSLKCSLHNGNEISWICLESNCPNRLLCSYCVIKTHSPNHSNYIGYQTLTKDPISTFSNLVINEKEIIPGATITEKISRLINKQEVKLEECCNRLLSSLAQKLNEVKVKYHDDLCKFMIKNERNFKELEKYRNDYEEFCTSYFSDKNISNINYIKEGIDTILTKYFSDLELQNKFYCTINSIPLIKDIETNELLINSIKISDIKWRNFCDRDLGFWTFDKNICPSDFNFSDNCLTAEKIGTDYPLTLLGNSEFSEGYYSWSVLIEEFRGKYLCLGVIPSSTTLNYRVENYSKACCICTDRYFYNMEIESGFLMINEGDLIEFILDFDKDLFIAKHEQFSFKKEGIRNIKFLPYFGFSKNSYAKLKIIK